MKRWISLIFSLAALIAACVIMTLLHRVLPGSKRFYGRIHEREVNVSALFYTEEPHALESVKVMTGKKMKASVSGKDIKPD